MRVRQLKQQEAGAEQVAPAGEQEDGEEGDAAEAQGGGIKAVVLRRVGGRAALVVTP